MTAARTDLMVDIETLGTTPDSVILSIAAVPFNPVSGMTGLPVHVFPMIDEQLARGRKIDAGTLTGFWGVKNRRGWQDQAAANRIASGAVSARLRPLFVNLGANPANRAWCWGACFDWPILQHFWTGMMLADFPDYRKLLCARTACDMAGTSREGITTHDAVADCRLQIPPLVQALGRMRGAS